MLRSERDQPLIGLPRRLNAGLPCCAGDSPSEAANARTALNSWRSRCG